MKKSRCLNRRVLPPHGGWFRRCRRAGVLIVSLTTIAGAWRSTGLASDISSDVLSQIRFEQKLDSRVSAGLGFHDENGATVTLGEYLGRKPVVLVLGYYQCPMLCTLALNGLVESLQELRLSIGRDFELLNVSIDPRETPSLAAAKKRVYLRRYGRPAAASGWHFLTGQEPAISQLATEVGFHFIYDASIQQYAHPSGIIVLTPGGRVARYFFGVTYSPKELHAALMAASANKIGSAVEQLILLCFHYNPIGGRYSASIMSCVRVAGVLTVLALAGTLIVLGRGWNRARTGSRKSNKDPRAEGSSDAEGPWGL